MLATASSHWGVDVTCLSPHADDPASVCSRMIVGNPKDEKDVYRFGRDLDVITVEFDDANVQALRRLKSEGKEVHPDPEALAVIQDKGLQSQLMESLDLKIPRYALVETVAEVEKAIDGEGWGYPVVVKTRRAGYDGKGVCILREAQDLKKLEGQGFLIQECIDIERELSVIAIRNGRGEVSAFPMSELLPSDDAHLLDTLITPVDVEPAIHEQAQTMAFQLIEGLGIQGLLAIEFFLDKEGALWVNEASPRPHNSGHHTIEGNVCSQYEQHLRGIFNWPLGDTSAVGASAMVNLLGADGYSGLTLVEGLEEVLCEKGVHVHLYGKKETKPFRKMGHVTVVRENPNELAPLVQTIKEKLEIKA